MKEDQCYYDVNRIRYEFPILDNQNRDRPLVYFDSAASTQKPKSVIDTIKRFYEREYATVHRAVYELAAKSTERYTYVREKIKNFIGAQSEDEVIFTKGATQSINIVARCYAEEFLKPGDEIIITEAEHHSNIVPWQQLMEKNNIRLRVLPVNEIGEISLNQLKDVLSHKTKLVCMAYMTNTTATINPVKEVIKLSHYVGAKVLLDAAQAVGHLKINVQELDVDFLAFSSHKMYGPTGVGILYGKKEFLDQMPPYEFGGDMIDHVSFEKTTYQKAPLKFEAGTPMFAQVIGLGEAVDFIMTIGLDKIHSWEMKLLDYATSQLKKIPDLKIMGTSSHKGPIITFTIDGIHPLDLGTILGLKGVAIRTGSLCAEPLLDRYGLSSVARISFGMYNTMEEIDYFMEALEDSIALLKPQVTSY